MGEASTERIRSYVEHHRQLLDTPGLAIGLTDRERLLAVLTDGLANVDARTPVRPEDRFQIGSISKGLTVMALLLEREAGRLNLDAPVTEYLPWFQVRSGFGPITVHHLLSHTAGIVTGMDSTVEGVHEVWLLRETETGFAPGERFLYSNAGYKALGLILGRMAGRPWWEVVRERVMEPIGMGGADVIITNASRSRLAVGYTSPFDDRPWLPRHGWAASAWFESATADGTICATAEELAAYARLLLDRGRGVLTEESFALMTRPVAEDPETPGDVFGYGLKWIEGSGERRLLGHSGGMVGFTSFLLVDVESGFGVTVLCNSGFSNRLALARFALACLTAEASGADLPDVPEPADREHVEDAGAYAGTYRDEIGAVEVLARGDRLFLETDGARAPLAPIDVDRFAVDAPVARHAFDVVREGGVVTHASWGPRWLRTDRYAGPTSFSPPPEWAAFVGRYRSWNPWAPVIDIVLRRGELWLSLPSNALDEERDRPLEPLPDGSFRVGAPWSPDRVRFDTPIDGVATRAVLDAAPFYRSAAG